VTSRPESSSSTIIRRATASDAEAMIELVKAAYSVYVTRMGRQPAPMLEDYTEVIKRSEVWVAEEDGLVGVIVIELHRPLLYIENVAVAPGCQGRGIGSSLLSFVEHRGTDLGCSEAELYTNQLMVENLRLYRARGYQEVSRRSEHGYSRVFLRKQLIKGH
jgi:ribosomal protein S18 acetylase RimI-like enzyme